jgi:hypothetical protein
MAGLEAISSSPKSISWQASTAGAGRGPNAGPSALPEHAQRLNVLRSIRGAPSRHQLYVLCTETLTSDWNAYLRLEDRLAPGTAINVTARATKAPAHAHPSRATQLSTHPNMMKRSMLSAEEKAFVRNQLLPKDAQLHAMACRRSPGEGRNEQHSSTASEQ